MAIKYPDIEVKLTDQDGNAMVILGAVRRALKRAGVIEEEISKFTKEATSGDYDNLLAVCMEWVDVS